MFKIMSKEFPISLQSLPFNTSLEQPQNNVFCPPYPQFWGETEVQSPPNLGDLGG
jgi:hypothetical protein